MLMILIASGPVLWIVWTLGQGHIWNITLKLMGMDQWGWLFKAYGVRFVSRLVTWDNITMAANKYPLRDIFNEKMYYCYLVLVLSPMLYAVVGTTSGIN